MVNLGFTQIRGVDGVKKPQLNICVFIKSCILLIIIRSHGSAAAVTVQHINQPPDLSIQTSDLCLVTSVLYSPTGQQRSSSPRCSSPARSATEHALPSALCSVLSSPRPPQPRRHRWWHSGRWCSSPQSAPSGPAEKTKDGRLLFRTLLYLTWSANELNSPPERCLGNRAPCVASQERVVVPTGGTYTSLSGSL